MKSAWLARSQATSSRRVVAVGAGHAAGDEHAALVEIVDDTGLDGLVALDRKRSVDGAPGDLVVNIGGVGDKAVVGRTSGTLPPSRSPARRWRPCDLRCGGWHARQARLPAGQPAGRGWFSAGSSTSVMPKLDRTSAGVTPGMEPPFKNATHGRSAYFTHVKPVVPDIQNVFAATAKCPPNGQKSQASGLVIGNVLERLVVGETHGQATAKECPQMPAHKERP